MPILKFLLLSSTIAISLFSSGCSSGDPVRPIAAGKSALVVSTATATTSPTARKPFNPPALSTHQVYLIAREYSIKEKLILENDSCELNMKYHSDDKVWSVFFRFLPYRDGGFFSVIVSDKEAKVIRYELGE